MWSSLYSSENEVHEDFSNSTTLQSLSTTTGREVFEYGDETLKDEDNPDQFWLSVFPELGPGVAPTPDDLPLSTDNSTVDGTCCLYLLPPTRLA